jgi:hypothetical protein
MYVWQLSEELSFKTVAPDIDSAIVNIFNEVVQLCKQHENIYQYFELKSRTANKNYRIKEGILRNKLITILCLAYHIPRDLAHDYIDICYDYLNYTPVHRAVTQLLADNPPVLTSEN